MATFKKYVQDTSDKVLACFKEYFTLESDYYEGDLVWAEQFICQRRLNRRRRQSSLSSPCTLPRNRGVVTNAMLIEVAKHMNGPKIPFY